MPSQPPYVTRPLMSLLQVSVAIQNLQLDQFEIGGGTDPYLRFYTGTKPATTATALSGNTLVAEMVLPSNWMADATSGSKALLGTWQDLAANATGDITFARWYKSDGTTCFGQGDVTEQSGGGIIDLDNKDVNVGQKIVISSFNLTSSNA